MHNEYDNEKFFGEYAKMPRSRNGLGSAGEWHQLKPLFPPLQGKTLLDLGCGYGWHCKFAAEQGAIQVLGIDLSRKMIEEAKTRNAKEQIEYRICGIEEYEYPDRTGFFFSILSTRFSPQALDRIGSIQRKESPNTGP